MLETRERDEDKKLGRRNKREIQEALLEPLQWPLKSGVETAETFQGYTEEINFTNINCSKS
jgi:hypothetical protein